VTRLAACWLTLCLACDTGANDAPAKSRVQAVLAEPGANAVAPQGAQVDVKPTSEPVPAKPRPPLCEGKLDEKPRPFNPKRQPTRVSVDAAPELASDPLRKGHWTWVNFWAAWCVPCKEELPTLLAWQKALPQLEFAFVSMDDDERQFREFLERQPAAGLKSSYWLPDGELRQSWLQALGEKAEPELPLQLLIDPSGMLRCRIEGAVEAADLAVLSQLVK
jgi:thiol-disulfide isomerase/thioredoxin